MPDYNNKGGARILISLQEHADVRGWQPAGLWSSFTISLISAYCAFVICTQD
uniref:Uncharacterized protein n=1 Tax=Anguilla anguilla TaxID=7936 RepID=A0A0E9U465_ANGAN